MAEVKQQAICNLALSETETLLVYDALKCLKRQIWTSNDNTPLDLEFVVTDLMRTLTPVVNEIAMAQAQAQQQPPVTPVEEVPNDEKEVNDAQSNNNN